MIQIFRPLTYLLWFLIIIGTVVSAKPNARLKMVVLTGGHGFPRTELMSLFEGKYDYVEYNKENGTAIFDDISNWNYDMIIFHNYEQNMTQKRMDNLLDLFYKRGIPFVITHHAIVNYLQWPQFGKIIGARYYLGDNQNTVGGITYPVSTFREGVTINVETVGTHPILNGIPKFFSVVDEVYGQMYFDSGSTVLLRTNNPESDGPVAWTRQFGKSKMFYMQLGHSPEIYSDPTYRKLIEQGIAWASTPDIITQVISLKRTPHSLNSKTGHFFKIDGRRLFGGKSKLGDRTFHRVGKLVNESLFGSEAENLLAPFPAD
ncbi:MAG: ThuA domain-containing protein [Fibrobacterota bacterium]|nr:ThuA domain-containing protein [Fibrobacterota bacterium]